MMTYTENSLHTMWVYGLMFQSIAGNTCGEGAATISPAGGLLLQCKTAPQLLCCAGLGLDQGIAFLPLLCKQLPRIHIYTN